MPITVIGRPAKFCGKTFFEIVCNLKDFGVGRIAIRWGYYKRYKEPTYYRITKVEPQMDKDFKLGKVWAEKVFRGRNFGVEEISLPYKSDYRLVSKEDEAAVVGKAFEAQKLRVLPSHIDFPPLLRAKLIEEQKAKGLPFEEPKLKLVVRQNAFNIYRTAAEGEEPNINFVKHVSPNLYENVEDKRKKSSAS